MPRDIMNEIIFVLTTFCFISISVMGQTNEGDACVAQSTQPGICMDIRRCISVRNDMLNGKQNHFTCSTRGMTEIVCCPIRQRTTTPTYTTAFPTTKRTKTTRTPRITTPQSVRISVEKCNNYRRFALRRFVILTSTYTEETMSNCTSIPLIIGGNVANIGEFPHMALVGFQLYDGIKWLCGGSLISERFVLTAAHCSKIRERGRNFNATHVRLGEHELNHEDNRNEMDIPIEKIIPHSEYLTNRHYYDIALLKLDRTIRFSNAIRPACLYQSLGDPQGKLIVTGWGAVATGGRQSDVLMKVELEPFSHAYCNSTLQPHFDRKLNKGILEESQMCAGSHKKPRDTCQGDSGGPLQTYHATYECTYDVVGVTSFGVNCGIVGMPAVYTRVSAFLDWIEPIVWGDE